MLLGLDIGGTKIGIAVGSDDGEVLGADRIATDPASSPEDLLATAIERLRALVDRTGGRPRALGVACPGPLSYAEEKLLAVPNMPRWQFFALCAFLRRQVDVPVAMMNDANASVLAESFWGAARGCSTAVFLTMSTGCGAGLLIDGRVFAGPLGLAGEVGHIRLSQEGPVGFGKHGSVEGFLSGPGIEQVARAELVAFRQRGWATALTEGVDPARIGELARSGDAGALAVVDRCGAKLGELCAVLVDLLNPDAIVLGTIGTAWFELLEPRARTVIDAEAIAEAAAHVALRPSGLHDRGNQTALAVARNLLNKT